MLYLLLNDSLVRQLSSTFPPIIKPLLIFTAKPESRHGGTAFANFIFDLAKHMKPDTNESEQNSPNMKNILSLTVFPTNH